MSMLESVESARPVILTLPDGNTMTVTTTTTGMDLAQSIAPSLAKAALAVKVNGEVRDLSRPFEEDAQVQIITSKDDDALELIRHDCAHLMAEAVQELYPDTQVTLGPNIENGFYYDFAREEGFTPDDLVKIEEKMREIVKRDAPISREEWSREEAIAYFEKKGEHFKVEIIKDLPANETISVYRQGDWLDLCRGPHMPSIGKVGTAFKLMKVAGAYWRGDSNNPMLQRIYGTAWRTQDELDAYLHQLEEAEKRDHRKLGREMDLFHFQDEAPGQVFWHPNGWTVYTELMAYMRKKIRKYGYVEVNTPQLLNARFWKTSGHWDKYRENMFVLDDKEVSEDPLALKPMSCPGNAQLYNYGIRSYRELPLRMAEFGKVFRQEASGARHGLMRVQGFTQDDAHIFCTDEQLEDEVVAMCDLIREVYTDLGMAESIVINFSTRPEMRIGSDEDWDRAESALQKVLDRIGMKWVLNPGDGAFYAPKLDFILTDAIGRQWQCGTVQVDMNMPRRLEMSYVGEDGDKRTPHMIHRAILGSVERFIGVLIEHYAGKFPLWLAPQQVVVATVTSEANDYAEQVVKALREAGLRVETDLRNEKIGYKIREHSLAKVPFIFVVGMREAEEGTVAIRQLGSQDQRIMPLDEAVAFLNQQCKAPY